MRSPDSLVANRIGSKVMVFRGSVPDGSICDRLPGNPGTTKADWGSAEPSVLFFSQRQHMRSHTMAVSGRRRSSYCSPPCSKWEDLEFIDSRGIKGIFGTLSLSEIQHLEWERGVLAAVPYSLFISFPSFCVRWYSRRDGQRCEQRRSRAKQLRYRH